MCSGRLKSSDGLFVRNPIQFRRNADEDAENPAAAFRGGRFGGVCPCAANRVRTIRQ